MQKRRHKQAGAIAQGKMLASQPGQKFFQNLVAIILSPVINAVALSDV
jgi:hypothetical protein